MAEVKADQCEATTYERAVGHDTRCRKPKGHEGAHDDGCLSWDDPPPWGPSRHLERTSEGPYIVDCSVTSCKDPTHFGGSLVQSAIWIDRASE